MGTRQGALPLGTPLGNFLKEVPKTFQNSEWPKTAFSARKGLAMLDCGKVFHRYGKNVEKFPENHTVVGFFPRKRRSFLWKTLWTCGKRVCISPENGLENAPAKPGLPFDFPRLGNCPPSPQKKGTQKIVTPKFSTGENLWITIVKNICRNGVSANKSS